MVADVDVINKRIFYRRSHPDMFCKKGALEYLANFIAKHLYKSLFLKEVWDCRPATLFQKRLMYRFFSVKCLKLFRTAFLQYTCESLPLVNLRKISEKTTLKNPSLIRGKSHGFCRSLLQRNFISFSLIKKTFSLNLLIKSDRLKNYEFLRFFLCDQPYRFRSISQTSELKSTSENASTRTWFIDFDRLCNYLNLFQKQPAVNFFNSFCLPVQGYVGHYINKFTETELGFFIKYLLRAI